MSHPLHLIRSQDLDRAGYDEVIRRAEVFLEKGIPARLMEGKVVATLFY
jgi:aspartate carbamoyltransferase catalytic subunit